MADIEFSTGVKKQQAGRSLLLRRKVMEHWPFLTLALAFYVAVHVEAMMYPSSINGKLLLGYLGILAVLLPLMAVGILMIELLFMSRSGAADSAIRGLAQRLGLFLKDRDKLLHGLPMAASVLVFLCAFSLGKAKITEVTPFVWDQTFDIWDRALHFGYRPWELLAPVTNNFVVTWILSQNYSVWFIIMNLFWVYYAFYVPHGVERSRFFLTFMLTWILGGWLVATFLSSAGPCYYALLGNDPNAYAGLIAHLDSVSSGITASSRGTQLVFWEAKMNGNGFAGISAMPSMHNATALIFVLTAWHGPKWLRNTLLIHFLLIFIGSIALAWHYAVDAYLAWAIVILLWWVTGHLARRMHAASGL